MVFAWLNAKKILHWPPVSGTGSYYPPAPERVVVVDIIDHHHRDGKFEETCRRVASGWDGANVPSDLQMHTPAGI